jgi:hypothetical protein
LASSAPLRRCALPATWQLGEIGLPLMDAHDQMKFGLDDASGEISAADLLAELEADKKALDAIEGVPVSLDACLPDLERKGEIDVGRSKEARALYQELKTFTRGRTTKRRPRRLRRKRRSSASRRPLRTKPATSFARRASRPRRSTRSAATMAAIRRAPGRSIPRAPRRCSASTAAPGTTIRLTLGTA